MIPFEDTEVRGAGPDVTTIFLGRLLFALPNGDSDDEEEMPPGRRVEEDEGIFDGVLGKDGDTKGEQPPCPLPT